MGTYRHKHRQSTSRKKVNASMRRRKNPTNGAGNDSADHLEQEHQDHVNRPNDVGNVGYWAPLWGDDCPPRERTGGWL